MMSIRTLRWVSVAVPTAFVVAFELVTHSVDKQWALPAWVHGLVALAAVSAAAFAFSAFVFAAMSRLGSQVREQNRHLALLHGVLAEASESLELDKVTAAIAGSVRRALRADAAGLAVVSEADGQLRLAALSGLPPGRVPGDRLVDSNDCECQKAMALGRPVVVDKVEENARCALLGRDKPRTCAAVPVRTKGRTTGALFVARDRSRPFAEDEVELIAAVGSQIGSVLDNAQLFNRAEAVAVLQERERVAREVHDGLAQTLGYLNVQTGIVGHLLTAGEVSRAQAELEQMAQVTREAHQDLRQAIADLRTPQPSAGELQRTLCEYAEKFSRQTGIPCHFEGHKGPLAVLSPNAEVQVVRIVQEALSNVKKHAPESQAWLSVKVLNGVASVAIRDNGPGFDTKLTLAGGGRFGLQTMQERAKSAAGSLRIESRPGAGTTINVTVPLENGRRP